MKMSEKRGLFYKACDTYNDFMNMAILCYMVLIITVLPFYHTRGYYYIATSKENFFGGICKVILPIFFGGFVLRLLAFVGGKEKLGKEVSDLQAYSAARVFAYIYLAAICFSFLCTDYKGEALWGAAGWKMGFWPQVMFVGSYLAIESRQKKYYWVWELCFPVSFLVNILGYLNRFGIYPIPMEGKNPEMISTIGNINWYCGYMVMLLFAGVYFYWRGAAQRKAQRIFIVLYMLVGFGSLITQGSSSGILVLVIIMLVLLRLSVKSMERMAAFCRIFLIFSVSCLITCVVRILFPDAITYSDVMLDVLGSTELSILLTTLSLGIYVLILRGRSAWRHTISIVKFAGKLGLGMAIGVVIVFIGLIVVNTLLPGSIGPLSEHSIFTFSPEWGSRRGAAWTAGLMCFEEQGILKKIIGVGPDAMGIYCVEDAGTDIKELLNTYFYGLMLTNAHNEGLTVLVNYGIAGLISYGGMLLCALTAFFRKSLAGDGVDNGVAGACAVGILAYLVHNIVSFQQIMNISLLFIMMGLGGASVSETK